MAMITCPECGRAISGNMSVCPRCGKRIDAAPPPKNIAVDSAGKRKKIPAALSAVLALIILAVSIGGGYSTGYSHGTERGQASGYASGYAAGTDTGYQEGQTAGYQEGREQGYQAGQAAGYQQGFSAGTYENGYAEGHEAGISAGHDAGYAEGREAGYSEGETDGYQKGYDAGYQDGSQSVSAAAQNSAEPTVNTASVSGNSPAVRGGGTGNADNFNTYNNPSQQNTTARYVLNTNSMKIHYPSCSAVKKISPANYATSDSDLSTLKSRGYTCCGICFK